MTTDAYVCLSLCAVTPRGCWRNVSGRKKRGQPAVLVRRGSGTTVGRAGIRGRGDRHRCAISWPAAHPRMRAWPARAAAHSPCSSTTTTQRWGTPAPPIALSRAVAPDRTMSPKS
jgi:hypothetical protein